MKELILILSAGIGGGLIAAAVSPFVPKYERPTLIAMGLLFWAITVLVA
jgi:hypothetical protein